MRKSVFLLSIHVLCAVVLLAAQGLCAEIRATFTATVSCNVSPEVELVTGYLEFWLDDVEFEVTGLPDNEYCIVETEVESISWQVNLNVYGEGAHAYVHSIQPGQNGGNGSTGNHDTLVNYGMYQIRFTGSAIVSWWLADNGGHRLAGQRHAPLQAPPKDFGNVWFSFRNPDGDPVNAPDSTSMVGVNEFTFNDSHPGELRIHLISEVYPDEIRPYFPGNLISYTVDGIAGSDLSYSSIIWYPPYTYHSCYAYFKKLPSSNSAFGRKTARMFYKGGFLKAHDYEVFYPRDAHNHPTCSTCENCPNWFYYWRQVYPQGNVIYHADSGFGETVGMTRWSYESQPDKTLIRFGNGHPTSGKQYGVGKTYSGIDSFIAAIIHEQKHVEQIQLADQLLLTECGGTNGNDTFRYGWSWNASFHNHWNPGMDGGWGNTGCDDDGDGIYDNASPIPFNMQNPLIVVPFEPGCGDDVDLSDANWQNRPSAWGDWITQPPYDSIRSPIEREAVKAANDAMDEHQYARQDWGNPGKNHGNKNKWDD